MVALMRCAPRFILDNIEPTLSEIQKWMNLGNYVADVLPLFPL